MNRLLRVIVLFCFSLFMVAGASAGPISPTDASRHIGKTVTVEGKVSQVHFDKRSGVTFINMGGRYPANVFTGVIFRDYAGQFPDIHAIEGQVVRISGKVKLYKGKPEIILRKRSQITRP